MLEDINSRDRLSFSITDRTFQAGAECDSSLATHSVLRLALIQIYLVPQVHNALLTGLFEVDIHRATVSTLPNPTVLSITVKVFPTSIDNDTISWQENTEGQLILCYRDGEACAHWLEYWQP